MFKDLYKVLNVSSIATQIEIKKSYRKLALKYHPGKTFGDKLAEEKFKDFKVLMQYCQMRNNENLMTLATEISIVSEVQAIKNLMNQKNKLIVIITM